MTNSDIKIYFVSLGCDKNLVDSESMLGLINQAGFKITDDENEADAVVVNTCCFIGDAQEESINTLIEYGKMKTEGKIKALIATGCLAQRFSDEIHSEIPEVDAILGTASFDEIVSVLEDVLAGKNRDVLKDINAPAIHVKERLLTNGGFTAYLKIAEGCDKKCTYCVIPSVRGNFRSVPMELLVEQAKSLADRGVKELILVAQETTVYGTDLYKEKSLHKLLKELCEIEGIEWIRVLYCYPEEIYDELIEVMKTEDKICKYIDMPIQHASDKILQRMGRRTNREFLENMILRLRKEIPDICIRTTLITGFPGETQEDFENLYNFADEMEFDRLGVFPYSPEEGTIAYEMDNQVPDEIKKSRRDEIMELQQEIAFEKAADCIGKVLDVMVEGKLIEDGVLVGRSYKDAPDVDGFVFIDSDRDLESGCHVKVKITDSRDYDLIGEIVD